MNDLQLEEKLKETVFGWARMLFAAIRIFSNIPIVLLPLVSALCCFLSHHFMPLMTSTSPSRGRLKSLSCDAASFHQEAHSLVLVVWLMRWTFSYKGPRARVKWPRTPHHTDSLGHWFHEGPLSLSLDMSLACLLAPRSLLDFGP